MVFEIEDISTYDQDPPTHRSEKNYTKIWDKMKWDSKFDDFTNIISFLVVNKVCLLETNCLKIFLRFYKSNPWSQIQQILNPESEL